MLLLASTGWSSAYAQTDPILEDSNIRPFTASGSVGFTANLYQAWGTENRRAPASFRANASTSFDILGFSSGLNLLYSTDQSRLRQNLNTISFDATWKWLTVQAGDVSPGLSKYGLNGTTIRGGDVKLAPGNWEFEFTGGRSKRRIEVSPNDGFREPSFERMALAGKLGYDNGHNHYYISSHYSIDKNRALNKRSSINPQENLTVTPDIQYSLFDQALTLAAEVTASAFTRNLNSPTLNAGTAGVPSFVTGIFEAHTSSRVNYAGKASAELSLQNYGLGISYERIQPGFTSLGIGRIRDDRQKLRISPSVQLFNNKLSLQTNLALARNNLSGSRLETEKNTTVGTNIQFSFSNKLNFNANYNLLVNDVTANAAESSQTTGVALGQKQVAHTLMLQPTLTLQQNDLTHSVSLSESYYTLSNSFKGDQAGLQKINSDTYSTALSYNLSFNSGLSFNAAGNYLINKSSSSKNTSLGLNVGASHPFFERKLLVNLNGGFNTTKNKADAGGQSQINMKSRQLMFNLTGNYQLTSKDSFSLSIRSRSNSILSGASSSYSELEGSLNYRHRF